MISIIACIGQNRELGKNGDLCFRFKEDMAFFKKTTLEHACVMGRKTWESLPSSLYNRYNCVVTRECLPVTQNGRLPHGIIHDFKTFLEANKNCSEEIFILGGGQIYEQALPYAQTIYLTEVNLTDPEADTFFPEFNHEEFNSTILETYPQFNIIKYERKPNA